MAEAQAGEKRYPDYVTDGYHIYKWQEEYEQLLEQGKLKPSSPPAPKQVKKLNAREQTKLEADRKKALADAERAVAVLSAPIKQTPSSRFEEVFGSEPKDE